MATKTNVATFVGKAQTVIVNEGGKEYKNAVVRGHALSLFSENGNSPLKSLCGDHTLFHLEIGETYRVFVDLAIDGQDMRPECDDDLVGKWTYLAQPTKYEEQDSLGVWDDGVMVIAPVGKKNPLKQGKQYQVTVERASKSKFSPYMSDGITNPMIGKLNLALLAHASISKTQQVPLDVKPRAEAVKALKDAGFKPKKQETIEAFLLSHKNPLSTMITIFPEEKLAVVTNLTETPAVMTRQNLFKYLKSLSNINEYRIDETVDHTMEWGLRLLENFANRA